MIHLIVNCRTLRYVRVYLDLASIFGLLIALSLPTMLTGHAIAREKAKRAPLNIVPKANVKATSIVRRNNDASGQAASLPQLTPNGATLRRPVRSVAALPGGQGPVQIGALGALEESEIGLIDGLGASLWRKSRMSSVNRILPRLPDNFKLSAARSLAIALMLTRAAPPPGLHEGDSFFAQRLHYLLSLGETVSVLALVEMTGAAKRDPAVAQVAAEAALMQGDIETACGHLGALSRLSLSTTQKDFAVQLRAFCQVKAGDFAAAGLTLDLARESGMKDALFMDLLFVLTANIKPPYDFLPQAGANTKNTTKSRPKGDNRLTIMQTALLDLADIDLQPTQIEAVPQGFLAKFAKSPKQPLEIRLLLTERGIATRHIAPSYMQLLAGLVALSPDYPHVLEPVEEGGKELVEESVTGQAVETIIESDAENTLSPSAKTALPDVISRARQLQLIDELVTPKGQIDILQHILHSGIAADIWPVMVHVTAPYLRRLIPDASNVMSVDFVPYAVPALIWLGEYELANNWLSILVAQQGGLPSARNRNLQGLIRLASEFAENDNQNAKKNRKSSQQARQARSARQVRPVRQGGASNFASNNIGRDIASDESLSIRGLPPMEASLIGAVLETGTPAELTYIRSEIALLPFFGYDVPPFLTRAVKSEITDKMLAHMLDEMEAALAKARHGDVIVLALTALGRQADNGHYHMAAMTRILTALKNIGLVEQAQAIARDLLVLQSARLIEG